jgi:hypothetical protein
MQLNIGEWTIAMRNATQEELRAGLQAAYDRVFSLRQRMKRSGTSEQFRVAKGLLDQAIEEVALIEGELESRRHTEELQLV